MVFPITPPPPPLATGHRSLALPRGPHIFPMRSGRGSYPPFSEGSCFLLRVVCFEASVARGLPFGSPPLLPLSGTHRARVSAFRRVFLCQEENFFPLFAPPGCDSLPRVAPLGGSMRIRNPALPPCPFPVQVFPCSYQLSKYCSSPAPPDMSFCSSKQHRLLRNSPSRIPLALIPPAKDQISSFCPPNRPQPFWEGKLFPSLTVGDSLHAFSFFPPLT